MELNTQEAIVLEQRIKELSDHCDERFERGEHRFDEVISCSKETTAAVQTLSESIAPIVEIHRDVQGVAHLGVSVQKFGVWLVKWPLIGAALFGIYNAIIKFMEQL